MNGAAELGLPEDLPKVAFVVRRSSRSRDAAVRALQAALVAGFRTSAEFVFEGK